MPRLACPKCNNLFVEPTGRPSDILLVGDYPNFEDVRTGRCLSEKMDDYKTNAKQVLSTELIRVGIQLEAVRYINLWQHAKNEKECDITLHIDRVAKEIKGKKYVLLMGSDASKAFVGESSSDASGLSFKLKAFPGTVFVVSPNPATVISGNVGEFRLALKRFKKEIK